MQKDKQTSDIDSKERNTASIRKNDDLQNELTNLNFVLNSKNDQIDKTNSEVLSYKSLVNGKDVELDKLTQNKTACESENILLLKDKRNLETDLAALKNIRIDTEQQADSLAVENKRFNDENLILGGKLRDTTDQLAILRKQVEDTELTLSLAIRDKSQKESELAISIDAKNNSQAEADRQRFINIKLDKENHELSQQVAGLSAELSQLQEKYRDASLLLDSKEKELSQAHSSLSYSEHRCSESEAELVKVSQDNRTLQAYMEKSKDDADLQKRLREMEENKKYELAAEKRRLENEAVARGAEVRSVQYVLAKERDEHGRLLQNTNQTNEELNALKKHAELLEGHNITLNNELDRFVQTDDVVRKDLDRKYRVDYIKSQNSIELQRSIAKVRDSASPKRSPYRSNY